MNVLRELRKFKTKSAMAKIRVLILLAVMLIVSAYAWWEMIDDVSVGGIRAVVETWDVEYSVDGEEKEGEITFAIDNFYPGCEDFEKTIAVKNLTETNSIIKCELVSAELFGEDITDDVETSEETFPMYPTGKKVNLFTNYPFKFSYFYDKNLLEGEFVSAEDTPDALATVTISGKWDYDTSLDVEDTYLGKKAYEFYETAAEGEHPLVVTVKITTSRSDMTAE